MLLTGEEIKRRMALGDIKITPFDESRLNPNSYNLRLANELMVYTEDSLDMKKPNPTKTFTIPEEGFTMEAGKLYLARTMEYTKTEKLVPMLEGRSSIGRLGLFIHVTAGFGDVGFAGYWTLEMYCIHPITIYPGTEICQIYYHTIEGDVKNYASGKYQNNEGIQPSLLYRDFEKAAVEPPFDSKKQLHVWFTNYVPAQTMNSIRTHFETKDLISQNQFLINTIDLTFCSVDTLDAGYDIVLHMDSGTVTLTPDMKELPSGRAFHKGLNLEKLLLAGEFGV